MLASAQDYIRLECLSRDIYGGDSLYNITAIDFPAVLVLLDKSFLGLVRLGSYTAKHYWIAAAVHLKTICGFRHSMDLKIKHNAIKIHRSVFDT